MKNLLSTGFIAKYCEATPISVARWIKSGKLKGIRTPGGRFRVFRRDFLRFLVEHQLPIDEQLFPPEQARVLVVDDDPAQIKFLSRVFQGAPFACELAAARDGYEAGLQAARFRPDLIVMDIMMPGLSGIEVCRKIRADAELQATRILVVTGYFSPELQQEALDGGADVCLPKPVDPEVLLNTASALIFPPEGAYEEDVGTRGKGGGGRQ